ncbi:outer membrane channel protein TolC [Ferrimonas lipolytica]|uniref:Outer membrane channel protein TolC n=1 Tax=Ferrimonas lipolytica TaxID=2724191 RepID=A0A6H1UF98_9GAMM|nr:outer membrane channel protein TolC [Ferrimonas lipolytica]QIZ77775.1 outer membrane channel protein TolC [Ferrimonas lipolytica]
MDFKLRSACLAIGLSLSTSAVQADDLMQIYQLALTKDPVLLQADYSREAAYERIGQSRANLLPQINASLGYSDIVDSSVDSVSEVDSTTGSITLSQSIYDHSNYVNLGITKQSAAQSELNFDFSKQDLIVRVAQAYFDVLSAQDNLEFVLANKRAIERQLEQTKQRFAVGLTAITDVHEAQAQYDLAVANEIGAQNSLENNFEALREITGMAHKDLNILDTERFSPSKPTPTSHDQWQTIAEESSIALLINRLSVEIAKEQINLARTGHMPSISFSAGYNDTFSHDISSQEGNYSNIGINVSIPIFSGFRVTGQVDEAKSNYVVAQQSLEETHRSVVRSTRASLNNVNSSISSIRAFEQSVVSAESALKATEAGFEVGTRTIVDVLDSTQQLYSAKQQLADARYNYIISVLALKQAAGTLAEADLEMINKGLRPAS